MLSVCPSCLLRAMAQIDRMPRQRMDQGANDRMEAAMPEIERLLNAILAEQYPVARDRVLELGYPLTLDGVEAAMEDIDERVDVASGTDHPDAQIWGMLDKAIFHAVTPGIILHESRDDAP